MNDYSFIRLSKDKLKHLVTLYKSAFDLDVSIDFLERKYNTDSFGASYIGFLAMTKNDLPAAYYGVFPLLCSIEGREVTCAQSGDTMTHQDHRGKGLFIELAKRTYELAEKNNVKFIFGFPNANSYPGFVKKLNWIHKEDLNMYRIKISTLPLVKLVKKVPILNPIYKLYLNFILFFYKKRTKGFINSLSGFDSIIHNQGFYNYKSYFKSYLLEIAHKGVWLKVDGRLWIGDIESSSEEEFKNILNGLKKLAFVIGASEVHFHTHPFTNYDNYMAKLGSVKSKNPIGLLDLNSGYDLLKIKFQSADFDTF